MMRRRWLMIAALPLLALAVGGEAVAGKKKKKKKKGDEPPPVETWFQAEDALGACWYPPDFSELGGGISRMKRQETLSAMMSQWKGERDDGIEVDPRLVESIETALLGYPEKIEATSAKNRELCQQAMAGKGTTEWMAWLETLPRSLVKGECRRRLSDTMFWYLDLGGGWQFAVDVCDDNVVKITATEQDEYRVDDDGPWINATGDREKSTAGLDGYPCNTEGCFAGQLVLRFRGESGMNIITPVNTELIFDPPEHGTIDVSINDTSYFNNEYKVERGVGHHTSVTYKPAE